jgi:hypothetical protein
VIKNSAIDLEINQEAEFLMKYELHLSAWESFEINTQFFQLESDRFFESVKKTGIFTGVHCSLLFKGMPDQAV